MNMTGISLMNVGLAGKGFEILRSVVPKAEVVGLLVNGKNPSAGASTLEAEDAARLMGLQMVKFSASSVDEFEPAFYGFAELNTAVVLIAVDAFFIRQSARLAALGVALRDACHTF